MKRAEVPGLLHPMVGKPERVAFGALKLAPERFQVRNPETLTVVHRTLLERESRELLASLFAVLEAGGTLDPPIIWAGPPRGTHWVIDGHHRVGAMTEAGTARDALVWVQRFKGGTEAEARAFALEINRKNHLNMHPGEVLNSYWRALLCGEVQGTTRGRAKAYSIGLSTVQRMNNEKQAILDQLGAQARAEGKRCTTRYILENAPTWGERRRWRGDDQQTPTDKRDRAAVGRLLKSLTMRFANDARARPDVLLQAFEEFFSEATGQVLEVRRVMPEDAESDF